MYVPQPEAPNQSSIPTNSWLRQVLETADDFLAGKHRSPKLFTFLTLLLAGVEHEEAAGKWRAGDAIKSLRFFSRAVEVYDQGLQKFPQSLDLAYNKARVQLEVATHPLLVKRLDVPVENVLEAALQSHQYVLDLDSENADTLFNTAQVLRTIAENMANDSKYDSQSILKLLEEALELQSRCLSVQEMKHEENEKQQQDLMEQAGRSDEAQATNEDLNHATEDTAAAEDQWFAVIEPVTKDTLIDTLLAQLGTLTTTCSILAALGPPTMPNIAWIEEFSQSIMSRKLPELTSNVEPARQSEIRLAIAKFTSALLEADFRQGSIDIETYKRERDKAFDISDVTSQQSLEGLVANAESLISFETAISDRPEQAEWATARWVALSSAFTNLGAAAKIKDNSPDDTAKTHFLRGDCSLLQHQMAGPVVSYPQAVSNAAQLLKNAEVFYRNASKLYHDEDQKAIAALRSSLVAILLGNDTVESLAKHPRGQEWTKAQIQEMVDEGLLPPDFRV